MGLRFRRSFRLAPGVRINFSGSGASLSVGPRGASMNFGSRGTFLNTGIPGTGFYSRERIGTPAAPVRSSDNPRKITISATIRVEDDGTVRFLDADGVPLSAEWVNRAKRQEGEKIRALIEDCCDKINARVEALGRIHLHTHAPDERILYVPRTFPELPPTEPIPRPYGFLGWLFKSVKERIKAENESRDTAYRQAIEKWTNAKAIFDAAELATKERIEVRVLTDVEVMEEMLERALKAIEWPRETNVSAEVRESGRIVLLDVDLPEIEDMPKTIASVPGKGYKLSVREMSPVKIQKLYLEHVHGIGFRIIGEAFSVLPSVKEVVLSAFSQRPNKATGVITDEYLYSVRVKRDDWSKINFANLSALDVVTSLERFELRRDVDKSGVFRGIEPLAS